ncbi:MAG: formate dehydrogenase accessory sulfurtransferase FdhD, partial [Solirubrobacteraceae bacterium]|nr:formate dehydrogenase accessory sulfurtransferase FdhD [Solirubrobacteraceae bacterium]
MPESTRQRVARVRATVIEPGDPASAAAHGLWRERTERLAGEEPLEIRVAVPGGEVVATTATMRTPGQDFALAAGLLHAEGVIALPGDLAEIGYCAAAAEQQYNVVTVRLTRPPRRALAARTLMATASCGVCGTTSIDELLARVGRVGGAGRPDVGPLDPAVLADLPARLREAQPLFDETGGLHAAGLFTATGELLGAAEDVGRHNALDKVLGERFLAGGLPAPGAVAVLSGRVSFELVQKVAAAGIPAICAVSAPSSLAVTTAARLGITLAGFVRDGRMTVYSGVDRLSGAVKETALRPLGTCGECAWNLAPQRCGA